MQTYCERKKIHGTVHLIREVLYSTVAKEEQFYEAQWLKNESS